MVEENRYAQAEIALRTARRMMFARRLTYSIIQVRLREAAIEQAEPQAAALEAREDALAPLMATDMRRVAALTAAVEQLHISAAAEALEQILTALTTTVGAIGAQVAQLSADLQTAIALAERATLRGHIASGVSARTRRGDRVGRAAAGDGGIDTYVVPLPHGAIRHPLTGKAFDQLPGRLAAVHEPGDEEPHRDVRMRG